MTRSQLTSVAIAAIAGAASFAAGRILQATDFPAVAHPYPMWIYLVPGAVFGVIVGEWWALALPITWLFLAPFAAPGYGDDDTGLIVWSAIVLAPVQAAVLGTGIGARRVSRRLVSHHRPRSSRGPSE